MKIFISALGNIKKYIQQEEEVFVEESLNLKQLKEVVGIPEKVSTVYVVNDKVENKEYIVKENDKVKFISIVGAG